MVGCVTVPKVYDDMRGVFKIYDAPESPNVEACSMRGHAECI